jgi:hypothetical protein
LEPTTKRQRRPLLPRIHRVLPLLHQRLLKDRSTPDRSNKEESKVRLDRETTTSVRTTQNTDVCKTRTETTRLRKPFTLSTDASGYGVGAVLAQDGQPDPKSGKPRTHPVAYYSSTFTPTERNYDVYERELLAIVKALEKLETPSSSYRTTDHDPDRPRKSTVLEEPQERQPTRSQVAHNPTRLQLRPQTRPREDPRSSRHAITTPWSRYRNHGQPRRSRPPRQTLHSTRRTV